MAGSRKPLLRFASFLRPHSRWAVGLVVLGLIGFGLYLVTARLVRWIPDRAIADNDRSLLWTLAAVLVVIEIVKAISIYWKGLCQARLRTSMVYDVRQALWRHLQRLSLAFHHSRPTGSLLSRLTTDINAAQQLISAGLVSLAVDVVGACAAVVILLTISWQMTLVAFIVLPAYAVLLAKLSPRIREASRELHEHSATMSGHAVERLSGIAVVQSFAREPSESARFASASHSLRATDVLRSRLSWLQNSLTNFFMQIGAHSVWIIGGWMVIEGKLQIGAIIEFSIILSLMFGPLMRFSSLMMVYQQSMAAIERVFRIFDIVPEIKNRPGALDKLPGMGGIEFDNVRFEYPDRPPVLQDLTFSVAPGERVAIVGESGAGKSTLVTLVPRLYDIIEGSIRIDGIDVRDYRIKKLRRSIGIVLQESILFSGTVRENIEYGRRKPPMEDVIAAAKAANAHQFIVDLPDGYDTLVGERGLQLSGGQRQRLSIARTILQNPRILILDEATSSLDSESENLITEALQHVMAGRTCMVIAHRLSTVINADRILVMKEGQLVEQGPHEQLLAEGGYYAHLFQQQFGPLQELMSRSGYDLSTPSPDTIPPDQLSLPLDGLDEEGKEE
jgi:ABC-type multidrug transport system fused ATPase/permease subunit